MRFRGLVALSDVDLDVYRGETLGIIGPNGAGKTTLMNVITGFVQAAEGQLTFEGRDITGMPSHKLARMGISRTFQDVRLFSGLTVLENIEAAAISAGQNRKDAVEFGRELLEIIGLGDAADRRAGSLPYGDERRLAVARAASTRPKLLLLDEPAAGLDEEETAELTEAMRVIIDRLDCTVAVIEHDMPMVMGFCSRIHVLDTGRTLATGTPQEIQSNSAVIEAYLGATEGSNA